MVRKLLSPVRQLSDGRWGFDDRFTTGKRVQVRRLTKRAAQMAHLDVSVLISNGRRDLIDIDPLELAQFRKWKSGKSERINLGQAIKAFIKSRETRSSRHVEGVRRDCQLLQEYIGEDMEVADITTPMLEAFVHSRNAGLRRQFNLRALIVTLFRWLREKSYLPEGKTVADKMDPIQRISGSVHVLSSDQLQILLDNVKPEFLPWLAIGAFAGIRSEEIAPDPKSRKSPLQWEDFKWNRRLIDLRRETAKTGRKRRPQRRLIPIEDNLFEWLRPWHTAHGPVCPRQPTKRETARLGKLIGGTWPHNCLRDSYGSNWMAIHKNMPALAYQMGNSIQMIEESYHERQDESDAQAYFATMPPADISHKIVTFKST